MRRLLVLIGSVRHALFDSACLFETFLAFSTGAYAFTWLSVPNVFNLPVYSVMRQNFEQGEAGAIALALFALGVIGVVTRHRGVRTVAAFGHVAFWSLMGTAWLIASPQSATARELILRALFSMWLAARAGRD